MSVEAKFVGGPKDGERWALESLRGEFRFAIAEPLKIQALSELPADPAETVEYKTVTYLLTRLHTPKSTMCFYREESLTPEDAIWQLIQCYPGKPDE